MKVALGCLGPESGCHVSQYRPSLLRLGAILQQCAVSRNWQICKGILHAMALDLQSECSGLGFAPEPDSRALGGVADELDAGRF